MTRWSTVVLPTMGHHTLIAGCCLLLFLLGVYIFCFRKESKGLDTALLPEDGLVSPIHGDRCWLCFSNKFSWLACGCVSGIPRAVKVPKEPCCSFVAGTFIWEGGCRVLRPSLTQRLFFCSVPRKTSRQAPCQAPFHLLSLWSLISSMDGCAWSCFIAANGEHPNLSCSGAWRWGWIWWQKCGLKLSEVADSPKYSSS